MQADYLIIDAGSAGCVLANRLNEYPATGVLLSEAGRHLQSDGELLDYGRRNGGTRYHANCTCMMGQHAMGAVDAELRVRGIEALRVIDASVMLAVTSTNTNAPTIMIAHKGATFVKNTARQKLAT